MWRPLLLFLLVLGALGCPGGKDLCARVKCEPDRECEPSTGICRLKQFAGDAGTDAGIRCEPACDGGVCDTRTGSCVACLEDSHCACPNPSCDPQLLTCQPPPDGGSDAGVGESCADAQPVPFAPCETKVTFIVDTSALKNDESGSCSTSGSDGKDAVYRLALAATQDVLVTAEPLGGGDAVVYLRRGPCASGAELSCRDDLGQPESLRLKSLPQGDYFLVVDSFDAPSAGQVRVTVELAPPTPPPNETCATAIEVPFDGGSTASFVVDTSLATDDHAGSCNNTTDSREVVYRIPLAAPKDLRATARGLGDGGVDPVLYLHRTPCGGGSSELACDDQLTRPEVIRKLNLQAGDYFLFVEGFGPDGGGPTEVTVALSGPTPPPPNDTCQGARLISFPPGSNTVSFRVDLASALDDHQGSCNSETDSFEVVYLLSLASSKVVEITSRAADAGIADPVIYLKESPCDGGVELGCDDQLIDPESISAFLSPGDYHLYVEGFGASGSGVIDVTVRLTP
ncbi:MAG: hypothetical protein HYZ28_24450 [Myxococcales bacterium]|nr:hypothetical protein [Myxococcales bacterium]